MEMLDGNRRLIRGMEEDGCSSCGGEAGLHRQSTSIQLLRHRGTRLQRMAPCLSVALLLLITVTLALLITVVLGGRGHQSPGSQESMYRSGLTHKSTDPMVQPTSHLPGASVGQQQLKDNKNPRAMLTAPRGNNTGGDILDWESKEGNAFCQGGFSYSGRDLVVPRKGIYRVFLQITYESKENLSCRSDGTLPLKMGVDLFRDTYPVYSPLLTSIDIVSCSKEPWSKSLYTAGLFSLEAKCRLRVTSSPADLVVRHEHQVFFGAELLSQ